MTDQINKELLKLQDELTKFEGSVGQILKSNELADNLINSSKELQNNFSAKLDSIKTLFSDYMNKTYSHTEKNLASLYEQFQERIKHEDNTLEQLSKLTLQNEKATQEYLQKVSESSNSTIQEFYKQTGLVLEEEKEFIKLQIEKVQLEIEKLMQEHINRLKTEQEILDSYLELAKETALITETIKNIDFPKHLEEISKKIEDTQKNFDSTNSKILGCQSKIEAQTEPLNKVLSNTEKITSDSTPQKTLSLVEKISTDPRINLLIEKNNIISKKINTTRTWTFIVFLMLALGLGFSVLTILTLYPNFFDTLLSSLNLK